MATDESADETDREAAIGELRRAHECDELARLVRDEGLEGPYRSLALQSLSIPQCDSTLRELASDTALTQPLRDTAQSLLTD